MERDLAMDLSDAILGIFFPEAVLPGSCLAVGSISLFFALAGTLQLPMSIRVCEDGGNVLVNHGVGLLTRK